MIRRCLTLALVALVLASTPAAAQSPAERQAAVALGEEALKLFEQGQWAEAYARFAKADRMVHAPPLVLYMARSQRNMGKLVEARQLYQRLAEEELHELAPEQFVQAKTKAAKELAVLDQRIPKVDITVQGAPRPQIRVTVDEVPLPQEQLGAPVPMNPGKHTIEARADGFSTASVAIELPDEAGSQSVELTLTATGEGPPPPPQIDTTASDSTPGPWWPGAVTLGVGGVGLVVGAITGGMAMSKVDDIKSRCIDNHCPPEDEDEGSSADTLATVSTVGFVAGGVLAAAGVVLLVWRPGGASDAPDGSASLRVGPAGVQLSGVF